MTGKKKKQVKAGAVELTEQELNETELEGIAGGVAIYPPPQTTYTIETSVVGSIDSGLTAAEGSKRLGKKA